MKAAGILLISTALLTGTANAEETNMFAAPQHAAAPLLQHAATNRAFQGIPSMAVTPGGRIWADWYAGKTPGEDRNNYVVLSTSGDNGKTWKEVLVVDPDGDGPMRTFDPRTVDGTRWTFASFLGTGAGT